MNLINYYTLYETIMIYKSLFSIILGLIAVHSIAISYVCVCHRIFSRTTVMKIHPFCLRKNIELR